MLIMARTEAMKSVTRKSAFAIFAALLLAGGGYAAYRASELPPTAPSPHVAALALNDTQGKPFNGKRLAGKPVAVFFGFTRCPDVCPMTLQRLARMKQRIGSASDDVEVIFVTLDPKRDTPASLAEYMATQPVKVTALTGSDEQISQVASHFGVFRERVPASGDDYTIDHTASLFLISRHGGRAGEIPFDASEAEFESKLRSLL